MSQQSSKELLSEAIARNCGLVLSLPSAGMLRHHKSRFIADDENGFWVESVKTEGPLIAELIRTRQPTGVSFRSGQHKIVFASPLVRVDPDRRLSDGISVAALLLAAPAEIKAIQRRTNYRVGVHEGSELTVRVWRIAERIYLGDRPMASQELATDLRDISTGGLGVIFKQKNGEKPKVMPQDRLRIELKQGETIILIEGNSRPGIEAGDGLRTGISFKSLDKDLEGRQKLAQLTRIVGELQRDEVRRIRRGMCNVPAPAPEVSSLDASPPVSP
jgi:c-di-GMP-binding flagellar brake protein YcgR